MPRTATRRAVRRTPKLGPSRPAILIDEADAALESLAAAAPVAPRPEPRPEMRSRDASRDASARAAEILGHLDGNLDEGPDEFYVNPHDIPDGWSYEWKRRLTYGAEDPSYEVGLARTGWQPVPADRHPSYMPRGYKGQAIERKGMVLMERPKQITDMVNANEHRKALAQVRQKEEQLQLAPAGQFERSTAKVTTSIHAPMPIPE